MKKRILVTFQLKVGNEAAKLAQAVARSGQNRSVFLRNLIMTDRGTPSAIDLQAYKELLEINISLNKLVTSVTDPHIKNELIETRQRIADLSLKIAAAGQLVTQTGRKSQ